MTDQELEAALDAADAGNWKPLEEYCRDKYVLNPNRRETSVFARLKGMQRVEYHRGSGHWWRWWRVVVPAFTEESRS